MSSKYNSSYKVSGTHEISIDHNGFNYLVIYGRHINGGFIAVPNWGISSEAGSPEDIFYNTEKLSERFDDPETAKAIAEAVCEHWESVKSAAFIDRRLSLRAKGMLAVLSVLPDGAPQTIESLSKLTPDGSTAVSSALRELETRGYIIRERRCQDGGRLGRTVITLKNMEEYKK